MGALEEHLRRQTDHSRDFFWHRLRWAAVSEYLPLGRRFELVDVGAGTGLLGTFLATHAPQAKYWFVEPLASLEAYLEKQFGAQANARGLATFSGIGYVALLDVIEHQEDDRAFLRQLVARMGPGSTLVLTVPALMSLWSGWAGTSLWGTIGATIGKACRRVSAACLSSRWRSATSFQN